MSTDGQIPGQLDLFGVPASEPPPPPRVGVVEAIVYGQPQPQGSMNGQRVNSGPRTGSINLYHQNHATLMPWRDSVAYALRSAHAGGAPLAGAVGVLLVFTMKRPKSLPKRRHSYPAVKPDLDKLLRSVLDAATTAGVWNDDAQVVEVACREHYTNDGFAHVLDVPGAFIRLWAMPPVTL